MLVHRHCLGETELGENRGGGRDLNLNEPGEREGTGVEGGGGVAEAAVR